ncbi:MAG: helix-turn-helix transcriptional regulator [Ignavibacteriae bacterium]|nr:helix-turn-helix transcriptional regulator [Ignavibacteriota bacterium]
MSFAQKIIEILLAGGASQGLFFGMLLATRKKRRSASNKILAILLVVLSASILHSLLAPSVFHSPYKIRQPFILFIGPLLSFYIYEVTGVRKITWKGVFHFVPFVILIGFMLPVWTSSASPYAEFLHQNGLTISKVIWTLIVLQFGFYWSSIVAVLHRLRTAVESEFSNLEGKTLSWMKFFLHIFGMFLFLLVLTLVIAFHTEHYALIDTIVCLGLSGAIFALGYNGLFQEEILSIVPAEEGKPQPVPENRATLQPALQNGESLRKLTSHLETSKPYLNETLTLTELATQLGMTRNQLSSLINSATGENFYAFISKYRVEEVKRLLADRKNTNFTILTLAHEAGFSSKSAFQSVFKKVTGLTPTEYRTSLLIPQQQDEELQ